MEKLERSRFGHNGGMLQNVQAELATFLGGIKLVLAWRWQQLKVLNKPSDGDAQDRQRQNNPRAASPPNTKWNVPEIVAVGLHLGVLLKEPLWPELLGILPVGRVVGKPPGVDKDLALSWDVITAKLGIVQVHVGDEEWDGHAETEGLFDHGLQVREAVGVRLSDLDAWAEDGVEFVAELLLDFRMVHELGNAPFN